MLCMRARGLERAVLAAVDGHADSTGMACHLSVRMRSAHRASLPCERSGFDAPITLANARLCSCSTYPQHNHFSPKIHFHFLPRVTALIRLPCHSRLSSRLHRCNTPAFQVFVCFYRHIVIPRSPSAVARRAFPCAFSSKPTTVRSSLPPRRCSRSAGCVTVTPQQSSLHHSDISFFVREIYIWRLIE